MNVLVAYHTRTGNTKMIADAVAEVLHTSPVAIDEQLRADEADFVAVGFWVDRGTANKEAAEFIKTLRGKKVAFFATLGADPKSQHAMDSLKNAAAMLDASNEVVGNFICQGKIDPKLIEAMTKFPQGHPHAMDEARRKRHQAASTHPDAQDVADAKAAFSLIAAKVGL